MEYGSNACAWNTNGRFIHFFDNRKERNELLLLERVENKITGERYLKDILLFPIEKINVIV